VTGFRPFFNPATGEWIEYTTVAEDTGGALVASTAQRSGRQRMGRDDHDRDQDSERCASPAHLTAEWPA
jgi:hypothetical protein